MKNKFNKNEIEFLKKSAAEEYRTSRYFANFRIQKKFYDICSQLGVCSIEEVFRRVLFHNWFELDISEEYKEHILRTAREYQTITRFVRNQMIDFGKNVSHVFGDLCTHSACLRDDSLKNIAARHIENVKADKESYNDFANVSNFRNLIGNSYNFKMIFDTVFRVEDDFQEDADIAEQIFQSSSAKYLMIVRMCMEEFFPVKRNRELSTVERDLINYLLYKGNEIDYMELHSVSADEFETMLESVMQTYEVFDIQELLIAAKVEESFSIQSLVYNNCFMNIRANTYLRDKEKNIEVVSEEKKEELNNLYEELSNAVNFEFLTPSKMSQIHNAIDKYSDCDFTILGKTDGFVEWYCKNIQDLEEIQKLVDLTNKIEKYCNLKK